MFHLEKIVQCKKKLKIRRHKSRHIFRLGQSKLNFKKYTDGDISFAYTWSMIEYLDLSVIKNESA